MLKLRQSFINKYHTTVIIGIFSSLILTGCNSVNTKENSTIENISYDLSNNMSSIRYYHNNYLTKSSKDDSHSNIDETPNEIEDEIPNEIPIIDPNFSVLVNKENTLSRDFIPKTSVVTINSSSLEVRHDIVENVKKLFSDAKKNGCNLLFISGYRSYDYQKSIYNRNLKNKGLSWTEKFSAKPGQSEHQTGLAIDISAKSINGSLVQSFANTTEGIWINENCAEYGFIIRYLKGKEDITGYSYEPWHLRYVGKDVATYIMDNDLTFEEYLDLIK